MRGKHKGLFAFLFKTLYNTLLKQVIRIFISYIGRLPSKLLPPIGSLFRDSHR